jgi:hypothetical protein
MSPAATLLALAANSPGGVGARSSAGGEEAPGRAPVQGGPRPQDRARLRGSSGEGAEPPAPARARLQELARLIDGVRAYHLAGGEVAERVRAIEAYTGAEAAR